MLGRSLGGPPAFPKCGPLVLMLATQNPSTPWRLGLSTVRSAPIRHTLWPNSSGVPDLSLANVELFLQNVVNRSHPVWRGRDVHVIQKREQPLSIDQPCPDGFQRAVLTQSEEEGHEGVPLFSTLSLMNVVDVARFIFPQIKGRLAVEKSDVGQNLGTSWQLH